MSGEAWLYLLAVLINAVNLFLQVFFTIMYSDLEWYVKIYPVYVMLCSRYGGLHFEAAPPLITHRANFAPATTSTPSTSVTASTPTSSPKPPYMDF
jgi:hypothetical protein